MLVRAVDLLEQATRDYWDLNNRVVGRSKEKVTVQAAIDQVNLLQANLGPSRFLRKSLLVLSDVIVQGKRNKKKTPATVTQLNLNLNLAITQQTISASAVGV